jgi:hypothetical protein
MNRCFLIHRLMGPCILLLLGTVALLHQAHLVSWGIFVPLLLILIGVLKLAERAALSAEGGYPQAPYPGGVSPAAGYPGQQAGASVSAHAQESGKDSNGGQS